MEGGGTGTCGEDYNTCAHFFAPVVCPELQAPMQLQLGDMCSSLTTDAMSACPNCTVCMSAPGQPGQAGSLQIHTCQLPDAIEELPELDTGDVCKSGGVETGPGVNRLYDCPVGSTCLPTDTFAIGGEVNYTCQDATTKIPSGGSCSLSGSMVGPAMPCEDGLDCIITDPGRPEVDFPNAGICLTSNTVLGFGAACTREAQSTPCAPTLRCAWTHTTVPSSTGYTCQHAGAVLDPPESCGGTGVTETSSRTSTTSEIPESSSAFATSMLHTFYALVMASTLLASHGAA